MDGSLARRYISVPKLTRSHCDMEAFRLHPKFGTFANSDLFPSLLSNLARETLGGDGKTLRLDKIPPNVTIDEAGFLATVTIEL